ncbi:hypothetical protein Nepgr_014977 [Nepenthes gracilis]|uniref:Phospholipase D n=1 Tax=Nepenthes gracilis TaxID=150966 RepID=A0AAD3SMT4_NEPGR|nr:hypothetical protein Nepgr_014977 [Nepenthes gracilis]
MGSLPVALTHLDDGVLASSKSRAFALAISLIFLSGVWTQIKDGHVSAKGLALSCFRKVVEGHANSGKNSAVDNADDWDYNSADCCRELFLHRSQEIDRSMSTEQFLAGSERYYKTLPVAAKSMSFRQCSETALSPIFMELPKATIVSVSRPDASDITPLLLSYTIEVQYRQFKWCLQKKASQVIYLHLALKKRAIIEEFNEKQEQIKEWLQNIGIGENTTTMPNSYDSDDDAIKFQQEGSSKHRYVPSSAALSIIKPSLGGQQTIADKAKVAMQGYLNHFLGNLDIVNSLEVCKFLEVSKLSFLQEYGPKLKEDYLMVKHLPKARRDADAGCFCCRWFSCCDNNWQKAWAVLKPGFLAFLEDPFDTKILDIIIFDILPAPSEISEDKVHLACELKERNPLRYTFKIISGNRSIRLRTSSSNKVRDWVSAINDSVQRPPEGWSHPHRYGSFAPPRGLAEDGSEAQWFIDGQAAFEAIASALEKAKSEIFITGWWLCPELYLRRPFRDHSSSRVDTLLEAKAKEGVQIYILLYKEVALALKINSSYSKRRLLSIHQNVRVLRYPDHFAAGVLYWSHHEKIVIVDYQICFIGGLDLCFGRYDTVEHKVGDFPSLVWPGKDYYNPRESEPNSWEDMMKDELDRTRYPRMPWHDVHCALWGPPCRDVARHFVQRWNYAKRSKAPNEEAIPLLMPHYHKVIPHYMGISQATKNSINKLDQERDCFYSPSPSQDIPLLLPLDSQEVDASNVHNELDGHWKNHGHLEQPTRNSDSLFCCRSKVEPLMHDMHMEVLVDDPEYPHLQTENTFNQMTDSYVERSVEWWETQERCQQDFSMVETSQVGPRTSCHCQVLRSASQWSAGTGQAEGSIHRAYCSLIEKAEHFIYIENQFFISGLEGDGTIQNRVLEALFRRILQAHKEQKCFRVIVVIPLVPGFQGGLDDGGAGTVRAIMHYQYRTISRGENSILHNLNATLGPKTHEYISFYGLRTYGRLSEGGPSVTNQVYVHSKLMIIDDRVALIGSANINDRSLLGSRDSEIGVLIEDKEFLESSMDGNSWKAGKFTYSLRLSLWSEHLGLHAGEISQIHDPVADKTYKDLWMKTAEANTTIYQNVFACVPDDHVRSRAALRQRTSHLREKFGYTTIDLGVAPRVLESLEEEGTTAAMLTATTMDPLERLRLSVRGYIVRFPLEFMRDESLKPIPAHFTLTIFRWSSSPISGACIRFRQPVLFSFFLVARKLKEEMDHFSSVFNGLARSLPFRKGKNSGDAGGREAAKAMAKEAKKNDLILRSSGIVSVDGSNNLASVFMKMGKKGVNQDCCIVWEEFGCQSDMIFCGIFDGHGPWGHFVAKMVRESMPSLLLCNWQSTLASSALDSDFDLDGDKELQWFNVWKHSYLKTCATIDNELEQDRKIDSFYSGTTALSIVRQGEQIIVANVGDSRAVLATTLDDGSLVADQLSVDFKPNLPQEVERIIGCNGRVFCLHDEPGVHRVWLPNEELPGLAMSRAFGDHCLKDFGVISIPQIIHRNISSKDQFIVLATDGVWDVISNQEAVQIVSSTPQKALSAKRLVEHAVRAWKRSRCGTAMDDISAICLFLHSPSSSSSSFRLNPVTFVK